MLKSCALMQQIVQLHSLKPFIVTKYFAVATERVVCQSGLENKLQKTQPIYFHHDIININSYD